jgi:hypothetical protein
MNDSIQSLHQRTEHCYFDDCARCWLLIDGVCRQGAFEQGLFADKCESDRQEAQSIKRTTLDEMNRGGR